MNPSYETKDALVACDRVSGANGLGWSLKNESEDKASAFDIYPVSLSDSSLNAPTIELYLRWLSLGAWRFVASEEPWLPVGRFGPLLVLGHRSPFDAAPPLPFGCFQPVLLRDEDYERQLGHCASLFASGDKKTWRKDGFRSPRLSFPKRLPSLTEEDEAFRFLLDHFPHADADHELLRGFVGDCVCEARSLPQGYHGASQFLLGRCALADLSSLAIPESVMQKVPAAMRTSVTPVAELGRSLWVAASALPLPLVEDQLLNELGEGWRIRFLLVEPPKKAASAYADGRQGPAEDSHQRFLSRMRLQLDPRPELRPLQTGGFALSVPGELRLSEREILDLERYDPRRPDRDPVKVFLRELSAAIKVGASDLHIEPGIDRARVRARVDGVLEEWLEMSVEFGQSLVGAAKEIVGLSAEKFSPQDGGCTVYHGSEAVSVRVSSYPIRKKRQKLVLRFLPRRGKVPSLDVIMPEREARLLRRASRSPYGLILLCGPTGSGKTTTVFSVLSELNSAELNITTMEDPVEYEVEGLNQAELDLPRGVSWEPLLKGFLRQDPDAGLIGEIRDRDTAETAIRQALTGHVVFATLHTMSCAQTVERLIDMGVNPDMLASALTLIVSQRLIRCVCPACRVRAVASDFERSLYRKHGLAAPEELWRSRASGCPECRRGYKGRMATVEMLPVTQEVAALIQGRKRAGDFADWAREHGFLTVYEAGLRHAAAGLTTLEEACEWQSVWEDFEWKR